MRRVFLSEMVRDAIIPGMAQAKLESIGTKDFPFNPDQEKSLSMSYVALERYPLSSSIVIKKNNRKICGANITTEPTPVSIPPVNKE